MSVTRQGIGIGAAHSEGSRVRVTISQGISNEKLGVNLPDQFTTKDADAVKCAHGSPLRAPTVDNPLTHIKPIEAGPRESRPKDANHTPH